MSKVSAVSHRSHSSTRVKRWTSAENAARIIKQHGKEKFSRMVMACENISKLPDDIGLTDDELFKIVEFIEERENKGREYLRKETTGLARTIEFTSNRAFIHLKTHGVLALGKGFHKSVTKTIMYAAHAPEIVANCVGDETVKHEAEILKKIGSAEGLAKVYTSGEHKKKNGKKVYSVIMKRYSEDTVRTHECNLANLTRSEQVYVARDLMRGLESMHAKKIAHRDLHSSNFVVDRQEDCPVSAAIVDFGKAVSFDDAKKKAPKVEVARHLVTPEGLIEAKHRPDIRKIEAFAIGCSLYNLFFGNNPEWCSKMEQIKVRGMRNDKKKQVSKKLTSEIRKVLNKRKVQLAQIGGNDQKYGEIILKLLDPNPKERFSPRRAREELDTLISSLHLLSVS